MRVRLTQIDGSLPNLALMKLSAWHKSRGDEVVFTRQAERDMFESDYDRVYGSAIFKFSAPKIARFLNAWPGAILGGSYDDNNKLMVEDIIGDHVGIDYSLYPAFRPSIGYTQRGCRFACGFCSVPIREGKARTVASVYDIWRGEGHAKQLHLLDNDFFGQPKREWLARLREMREGGFRVCFNQGVNIRVVTPEIGRELASVEYRDDRFSERRLYTAWDSIGDERIFFRGVDTLEAAGIPPKHLRAYMLLGWDEDETWDAIHYRFEAMVARGIEPYPMVFDCRATDQERYRGLKQFQRWAITGLYRACPFSAYDANAKRDRYPDQRQLAFFECDT